MSEQFPERAMIYEERINSIWDQRVQQGIGTGHQLTANVQVQSAGESVSLIDLLWENPYE